MRIGGLQRLTLIDYPGKVAAIVFTQGCNLRCGYCYNSELVIPERFSPGITEEDVLVFLYKRRSFLDGVVVSGGEPTIQKDLMSFLKRIKQMGFAVKLDTNGTLPDELEKILKSGLADYVAMDIKTSLEKYDQVTGVRCSVENIKRSIELIRRSGVEFEFRTTVLKPFCAVEDLQKIRDLIGPFVKYRLQRFQVNPKMIDQRLLEESHYSEEEADSLRQKYANC